MGKLGAVTGAYLFGALAASLSYITVMFICAGIAVLGAVISYVCIRGDTNNSHKSSTTASAYVALDDHTH